MKQLRKRLTYANVMSTIAVFLVIGGASAFAAVQLGKNTIGSKQLKRNAVTTAKIKKEAVAAGKIKNGAVGSAKLASGAVDSAKLASGAVDSTKLANGAVDSTKLADGAVGSTKLAKDAVSTEKIANGAVTNGKLAANSVTGDKVQDGSLSGSDIDQNSLGAVKAANVYATYFKETGGTELVNPSDPGIKDGGCFLVCAVEFPRDVNNCAATVSAVDTGPGGTGEPAMGEVFQGGDPNTLLVAMYNDEGTLIAHDFGLTVVCPSAT